MGTIEIVVGHDLHDALAEVGSAWKAAEAGQPLPPTDQLCFVDWSALCAVLTPKRYELIRHLRQSPAPSIRGLARDLGRDVKRVHEDVAALVELGLINRNPETGAISTEIDQVSSTIKFAA